MSLRASLAAAISAFTEFAGRLLAPATPWLFLALRRALIATICWVVLAVFFFVVPQSREVLHGLSEAPLASIYDFHDEAEQLVNTWALLAYAAMSLLVSFVVWYSARLLSSVDSVAATPPALAQAPESERLACAMVWLPRILGVSALASCIGALIYANCTPQLHQLSALAFAAGAVGAPLLVAIAFLMDAQLQRVRRVVVGSVGCVAFVAVVVMLWMVEQKFRMKIWSTTLAILPALLLVFLVKRRELFIRMKLDVSGMSATAREFGREVVTMVIMLVCSAVALLLLAFMPTAIVRGFGSAATVLLFLATVVLILTAAQLVLRRTARNVPGFTTATIIVIVLLALAFEQEPLGTEQLQPGPRVVDATTSPPSASGQNIYISAFGGGLRAAIFTAEVLAQADDTTCGEFGSRIAAMSGVSGGGLGIATYLIARQSLVANGGWKDCVAGPVMKTPLTEIVTRALVQDHLSTAIARMLAVDAARLPGSPQRGRALLDSWHSALVAALESDVAKPAPLPGLATRIADLTGGMPRPPRVYFNTTDADTGNIAWFSNRVDGECNRAFAESYPVGQAVLHSSRFPIVTPAGEFVACETSRRLVDGGYADNSGATTLDTEQPPTEGKPLYLVIDGNPPEKVRCQKNEEDVPPLPTAIGALLEARQARAELAVRQLAAKIHKDPIRVQLDVEKVYKVPPGDDAYRSEECEKVRRSLRAPLGWYVSYGAAKTLAASAQIGVEQLIPALAIGRKQTLPPIMPPK